MPAAVGVAGDVRFGRCLRRLRLQFLQAFWGRHVRASSLRGVLIRGCNLPIFHARLAAAPPILRVKWSLLPFRVDGHADVEGRSITLTLGLFLDAATVEHVVLHELAHFLHRGHGRQFKKVLARATRESTGIDVDEGRRLEGYAFDHYCVERRQRGR